MASLVDDRGFRRLDPLQGSEVQHGADGGAYGERQEEQQLGGAEVVLEAAGMQDGDDDVVMLDATPRGQSPGTLYVIEPEIDDDELALDAHGMDPVKVLSLVQALGGTPPHTLVVGCEPQTRMSGEEEDLVVQLSAPVRAALDPAVKLVESLLGDLTSKNEKEVPQR